MHKIILDHETKDILLKQRFGVLATKGLEYPYASLLAFGVSKDFRYFYIATKRDTSKYRNILKNQYISFLIYNLGSKPIKDGRSITALGKASIVRKGLFKSEEYIKIHPELKSFIKDPNCALIRIKVEKYVVVKNFEEVKEIIC